MAFEPPASTTRLRASDLTSAGTPYLLKAPDEDDSAWNLVEQQPVATLVTAPDKRFLPEEVTVSFADGAVRMFEPNDPVLVGPVTKRLGGDCQQIREVAEVQGFQLLEGDGRDLFSRGGMFSIEVYYDGETAITARRSRAGQPIGLAITGRGAKNAAMSWLTTTRPDQA